MWFVVLLVTSQLSLFLVSAEVLTGSLFVCNGTQSCANDIIECDQGSACEIFCVSNYSCESTTINCPTNSSCDIIATTPNAAPFSIINCPDGPNNRGCEIQAEEGASQSFISSIINCGTGSCIIEGWASYSFKYSQINCGLSAACVGLAVLSNNQFEEVIFNGQDSSLVLILSIISQRSYINSEIICGSNGECEFSTGEAPESFLGSLIIAVEGTTNVRIDGQDELDFAGAIIDARAAQSLSVEPGYPNYPYGGTEVFCPRDGDSTKQCQLIGIFDSFDGMIINAVEGSKDIEGLGTPNWSGLIMNCGANYEFSCNVTGIATNTTDLSCNPNSLNGEFCENGFEIVPTSDPTEEPTQQPHMTP